VTCSGAGSSPLTRTLSWEGGGTAAGVRCTVTSLTSWRMWIATLPASAQLPVDLGDLLHPAPAIGVFELQDDFQRPVEVIGDVGYLLVEPVQGVAYDSPRPTTVSTSKSCPHSGHFVDTIVLPFSLIRRYSVCR